MRFIHMADLHLGRRLGEFDLLDEQRCALEGILRCAGDFHPDVCLIAGDVYDRAVPPAEAVSLLNWFVTSLTQIAPVCLIGGNHDSPERLSFGRDLLGARGLHIAGRYEGKLEKVSLCDRFGPVDIWMMPFFRAREVRHLFPDHPPETIDQAVRAVLAREAIDFSRRNLLVMHQFVINGGEQPERSESEALLDAVGGLDAVDVSALEGFSYVALGHLHGPQKIGRDTVRYAGSPLKYSASESRQKKRLVAGEIDARGDAALTFFDISARHDVRCIRGTLEQLTAPETVAGADPEDYLFATLTDECLPMAPRERLEAAYPNLVRLDFAQTASEYDLAQSPAAPALTPFARFEAFFSRMNGHAMDEDTASQAREAFGAIWEEQP